MGNKHSSNSAVKVFEKIPIVNAIEKTIPKPEPIKPPKFTDYDTIYIDYPGNDLKTYTNITLNDCINNCEKTENCVGVVSNLGINKLKTENKGNCSLKSAWSTKPVITNINSPGAKPSFTYINECPPCHKPDCLPEGSQNSQYTEISIPKYQNIINTITASLGIREKYPVLNLNSTDPGDPTLIIDTIRSYKNIVQTIKNILNNTDYAAITIYDISGSMTKIISTLKECYTDISNVDISVNTLYNNTRSLSEKIMNMITQSSNTNRIKVNRESATKTIETFDNLPGTNYTQFSVDYPGNDMISSSGKSGNRTLTQCYNDCNTTPFCVAFVSGVQDFDSTTMAYCSLKQRLSAPVIQPPGNDPRYTFVMSNAPTSHGIGSAPAPIATATSTAPAATVPKPPITSNCPPCELPPCPPLVTPAVFQQNLLLETFIGKIQTEYTLSQEDIIPYINKYVGIIRDVQSQIQSLNDTYYSYDINNIIQSIQKMLLAISKCRNDLSGLDNQIGALNVISQSSNSSNNATDETTFLDNINRKYAGNIMENFSNEIDTINDHIEKNIANIQSTENDIEKEINTLNFGLADIQSDTIMLQYLLNAAETEIGVQLPNNYSYSDAQKIKNKIKDIKNNAAIEDISLNTDFMNTEKKLNSDLNQLFNTNSIDINTSLVEQKISYREIEHQKLASINSALNTGYYLLFTVFLFIIIVTGINSGNLRLGERFLIFLFIGLFPILYPFLYKGAVYIKTNVPNTNGPKNAFVDTNNTVYHYNV
jgi:hypothetical protein